MKKRLSKFEMIRILAMFLIVLHHAIVHGICDVNQGYTNIAHYPINGGIAYELGVGGVIGVYLFVLITGYFMIKSHISLGKLFKLWLPIFFWSVLIFFVFNDHFNIKALIASALPVLFGKYWFMTVYMFMYCLIPVLNSIVNNLKSKKEIIYLIVVSLFIIIGAYPRLGLGVIASRLANFCIVYCIGAIIRSKEMVNKKIYVTIARRIFIVLILVNIIVILSLTYIGGTLNEIVFIRMAKDLLINHWTIIGILEAITLFFVLGAMNIQYNFWINKIATTMFGVYLISDNLYMRNIIWHQIFHMEKALIWPWWNMVGYALGVTVVVFVSCAFLELLRQLLFSRFENKAVEKINNLQKQLKLEF